MEKQRWEESEKRKREKEEDPSARKGRKVAIHCVFQMICGSGGSKSRLTKAAGAKPAGQMRDEKLHAVEARSTFGNKKLKTPHLREHFWKLRCRKSARRCGAKHISKSKCTKHAILGTFLGVEMLKKVHAVVARSTFPSQNVQNTPFSEHFWNLRCRKSARRCGAKHMSKSKCTKHTILGTLLEVEMSKKFTPLWREAHFQVKMYKTLHSGSTFGSWDVEKVHAVVARSTFPSQNAQNTPLWEHFWKLRCWKSADMSKSKCTKHTVLGTLLEFEMSKKCTPLWREAHVQVKMYKTHHSRNTFGSWDVEKVHAVVARSTFPSQMYKTLHSGSTFGSWDVEKVHAVVARSTFPSQNAQNMGTFLKVEMLKKCRHVQVKMYKTHHSRNTFGIWDVEKVHAVVARSTCPSQNVQNTPFSEHFWKLRCQKSARRCGAKHISKSKCTKHTILVPLLEVEMSKKCTSLWREAHVQVKMCKTHHSRNIFGSWDVEKVHAIVARSTFSSQNVQSTPTSDRFWKLRCRKSARCCGAKHISKSKWQKHHMFGPFLDVQIFQKVHAVVARTTLGSQECQKLRVLTLFWRSDVEKVHTK